VACADIPALRELAQNAALYFNPRQPESIARTLAEALDSPATLSAQRERGQWRARTFTWERAALQTLEVYRQLTG
jgi:alpha-1,3-rhamnosyl/mannosyltransferase